MKKYGLIGHPLTHSFSESYFQEKFYKEGIQNCEYKAYPLTSLNGFRGWVIKENLSGLNVTIPYKEAIIPFLDELTAEAKAIGAVNTLQVLEGKLIGHNTDCIGFNKSLAPLLKTAINDALILGSGGASKAISYSLQKMGIHHQIVSRKKSEVSYSDLTPSIIKEHLLIINATPLGTHPNIEQYPAIPYDSLTEKHLLYDLVYNPAESLFLTYGRAKKCQIKNGLEMLHIQAEESWKIWNS